MVFTSLTIVMDNRARDGFRSSWGLALLLEGDMTLLFDAGPSGDDLLFNLASCGCRPADIDVFFLSHSHVDHGGGLQALRRAGFSGEIILSDYAPLGMEDDAVASGGLHPLHPGLFSIRLEADGLHEQSLLAASALGPIMLVGCAHPGLERIWDVACTRAAPIGVIGGFHDSQPFDALGNTRLLGPCHCTRRRDEFRERFPRSFLDLAAGDRLDLSGSEA